MDQSAATQLVESIREEMRLAMKSRERVRLSALRSLLARISNAEAVALDDDVRGDGSPIAGATHGVGSTERPRRELTLADIQAVVRAEFDELRTALQSIGETDPYALELRQKIEAIRKYA